MQIDRMTLEAEHVQDPSVAPVDHQPASQTPPVWRGLPVQMQLPPHTGPVKVDIFSTSYIMLMIKHIGWRLMPFETVGLFAHTPSHECQSISLQHSCKKYLLFAFLVYSVVNVSWGDI